MKSQPTLLLVTDEHPLPVPFPNYRCVKTQNSDEAIAMIQKEKPTAIVVAANPEIVPMVVSRLKDRTRQPIVALTPNEPREAIKSINAGAYDAAVVGTLAPIVDAAMADGLRIQQGKMERLGPYELLEIIGRGSMATVYRAGDGGREVALKVLFPELSADRDFVERFEREARSAVKLSHPNLAGVLGHGRARWRLWMAMELVRGRTLDATMKMTGKFASDRALRIVRQVADGLGYAHQKGFVHRDIKPSNLLIDASDNVKIMDFGLLKSTASDEPAITRRDEFVGTIAYAAPEQLRSKPCDGRTDLYALGIVLFEMIGGRRPFASSDHFILIRDKEAGKPAYAMAELNVGCPPAALAIIERLMKPVPADRFPNAAELVRAIDAAIGK